MSKTAASKESPEGDDVFDAVKSFEDRLSTMETFIARRFDEISMEINATAQQVDMAEEGIAKRFGEILEVIHAISHSGDGNTPANAGVELDAVVEMTEDAANRILDAADRISSRLKEDEYWEKDDSRKKSLEDINQDVEEIFMACSFQDITGQRIRKTLENLKMIEDRLGTALHKIGIDVEIDEMETPAQATSQEEIDALFSEGRKE